MDALLLRCLIETRTAPILFLPLDPWTSPAVANKSLWSHPYSTILLSALVPLPQEAQTPEAPWQPLARSLHPSNVRCRTLPTTPIWHGAHRSPPPGSRCSGCRCRDCQLGVITKSCGRRLRARPPPSAPSWPPCAPTAPSWCPAWTSAQSPAAAPGR